MLSTKRDAIAVRGNVLGPRIGPLSRTCTECGSTPGIKCQRYRTGRYNGIGEDGGYWYPMKNPHKVR